MMSTEPEKLRNLIRSIFMTHRDEIGCDTCFDQMDLFAELTMAGKDAASAMPHVYRHLQMCQACREEFEALLSALKSM